MASGAKLEKKQQQFLPSLAPKLIMPPIGLQISPNDGAKARIDKKKTKCNLNWSPRKGSKDNKLAYRVNELRAEKESPQTNENFKKYGLHRYTRVATESEASHWSEQVTHGDNKF